MLERQGDAIRFHPTLLDLSAHYRFEPRPVALARGNEKGRVERAIRYIRDSFFAARQYSDVTDLNAQAAEWCLGVSADRQCPEDPNITVGEAFEQERTQLIKLPDNPYPTDECVSVSVGKTPYVRFDLNDYSVPHTQTRRTVTVMASLTHVRIGVGQEIIAEHRRVYGKGEQIEDPNHIEALVSAKRKARHHRGQDRLVHSGYPVAGAAPSSRALLQQAAERGTPLTRVTAQLNQLLDDYGAAELEHAITEALSNDVPHPNSVRQVLERRREQHDRSPPLTLTLSDSDKARNIVVRPPSLARYDQLDTDTDNHTETSDDNTP